MTETVLSTQTPTDPTVPSTLLTDRESHGTERFDRWLSGLSVYQDILGPRGVVRRGERDCQDRWRLILPHLPQVGAMLDVGSNFGWFALHAAAARPDTVVLSAEADVRSAQIQRHVLENHLASGAEPAQRVALMTRRFNSRVMRRLARRRQRFSAALCLSVLHWMPDHEPFLRLLGALSDRIFVEFPHPGETGAGVPKVCHEIGGGDDYLRRLFGAHRVTLLGETECHRDARWRRPLWLVETGNSSIETLHRGWDANGLHVDAALDCELSWPPRRWWQAALDRSSQRTASDHLERPGRWLLTPQGLRWTGPYVESARHLLRRRLSRVPQAGLLPGPAVVRRSLQRWLGRALHAVQTLGRAKEWP